MEKRIYLVRHGESQGNIGDKMQGSNTPLSDEGHKQAENIAKRFKKIKLDTLISSTYARAKETAVYIGKETDLDIIESNLFVERIKPSKVVGILKEDASEIMDEYHRVFNEGGKYDDSESFDELWKRAGDALNFLIRQDGEDIIVASHGLFIRAMLCKAIISDKDINPEILVSFFRRMKTDNTGVTFLEYKYDQWWVRSVNDISHFAEE